MKLSWRVITALIWSGCLPLLAESCPEKPLSGQVCIDRKQPVSPLPLELEPNKSLTIKVVNKSPWEKISFDSKFDVVEDDLKKQLETLFKFLVKIVIDSFAPAAAPQTCTDDPISMDVPAGLREPFQSAFEELRIALAAERATLVKRGCDVKKLGTSTKIMLSRRADSDTFETDLTNLDKEIARQLNLAPVTVATSEALLHRANALCKSPAYFSLSPETQKAINLALREAVTVRTINSHKFSDLNDAESALAVAHKLFAQVAGERDDWLATHKEYRAPKNQKATIEITSKDRSDPNAETAKLATITATWKVPTTLSMSLGLGFSGLAKKDYAVQTVRGSGALTTDGALTYRLQETRTRPVVFPLTLLHFRLSPASQKSWGVALAGGAGVDVSGDSPTGEILTGISIRFGALYISPLAHFGRRKELETGYAVGESTPKDFAPPTKSVWGTGFCLSFTYRLPF